MSEDETDFLVRRGEYSENLGDQHIKTAMEFKKAAILYKEAFGYFKKAGEDSDRPCHSRRWSDVGAIRMKDTGDQPLNIIETVFVIAHRNIKFRPVVLTGDI